MRTYTKQEQTCIIETDLLLYYFISSLPGFRQFAGRFGDQRSKSSRKPRSVSSKCNTSRFVASGDEYVRITQTTDYGNNLDAYLNWLKLSHFGCNPCEIEKDDGSKSSSYLISFDKETYPVDEETLGKIMEYQKEQFQQFIRIFGRDFR